MISLPFPNRLAAAEQRADALRAYKDDRAVILAIPRGAVPMGASLPTELRELADDVIVLATPIPFAAVGRYYDDFSAVEDDPPHGPSGPA